VDLTGRNALVTGVSRRAGIGFAIARRLLDAGSAVFIHGWAPHDAAQAWGAEPGGTEAVARELDLPFVEADFADAAVPERVVAAATDALGALDILVVNHARSGHGALAELTASDIDAFLHENVRASLLLVREFVARFDLVVAGKQGWTDVAQFTAAGIPAFNFGPGIPEQAHQAGEYCPIPNLGQAFRRLAEFLSETA